MILLLSPSKTQDFHSLPESFLSSPAYFLEQARIIHKELLINVSFENINWLKLWGTPLGIRSAKPAIMAFRGEVYKSFSLTDYSDEDFLFAQDHIRIFSALYGLLKPLDFIEPHRLEMNDAVKIQNFSLKKFWKNTVTQYLEEREKEVCINLASDEYFQVIDTKKLPAKIIQPVFFESQNGTLKSVSVFSKQARGAMANWVVKNRIENAEQLKNFQENGYVFSQETSSDFQWIFIRSCNFLPK